MCNGPARAKTHSKVERTLVVEDDTKQKIETYCDGMQKVYAGVQDILFANYASLIAKVASDNTMTAADRVAKSKCVEQVTLDYSTNNIPINPILVRYVVKDVFELLKSYWYSSKTKLDKQAFSKYVQDFLKNEVAVVFSNDSPKLNLGSPDGGWYWQPVTLDCSIDKDSVLTYNTEEGQDTSILSQHRDSTHLVIGEDGQYHLRIVMSRDVPLVNPEGNILAIDVGLNRFFTALVRDNMNRKMHTHYCADN